MIFEIRYDFFDQKWYWLLLNKQLQSVGRSIRKYRRARDAKRAATRIAIQIHLHSALIVVIPKRPS